MDTSEVYVKMCEKAEEIQKLWKPEGGDYFFQDCYGMGVSICWESGDMRFASRPNPNFPTVWLPRQDQLQEMVSSHFDNLWNYFISAIERLPAPAYNNFVNSMEQLWLAFVMREKYGKRWDGEEWKGKD